METSVVEQLRLQEGRLFQNEGVLALFLDVKAAVNEAITSYLRTDSPISTDAMEVSLELLSPRGIKQYHDIALHDCVKIVAKLLWPTQLLLVGKPQMHTLLSGIIKRLEINGFSKIYNDLDPIKNDYIVREAFRRSLVNDCLYIFDDDRIVEEAPVETDRPVGSHSPKCTDYIPRGGTSVAGSEPEFDSVSVRSAAMSVRSVMPKVTTVEPSADDKNTVISTSSRVQREARNVRLVTVVPE
jgi:hypothetical protein